MNLLHSYTNGNTHVSLYDDGTKVREFDGKPIPVHPESMDVKITNYCDGGCRWCHEKSNMSGQHADLTRLLEVIKDLPAGVEIACLSGSTICYTENGAIEIKDLKIGDRIYDSNYNLSKITNISKSNKKPIKISANKGFSVISSKDHPFIINGKEANAQDTFNQSLDLLSKYEIESVNPIIDLAKHVTFPTNVGNKGGSVGGKVGPNRVRLNHRSGWCDRFINLTSDLMWLYGISIAEGSERGLVLNKTETKFANKAAKIYSDIFGKETNIRVKKNSIIVEFDCSSLYRVLMFDAMSIGKGARNKSLSYLFQINDKELIRSALFGMFEGDGAFRKRTIGKKKHCFFNLTYKTTSKKLAYEILFLLKKHFDISASIYYGISPERKIEGRTLKSSDYYKIDIYNKIDIQNLFPNLFSKDCDFLSIGNKGCPNNRNSNIVVNSIEEVPNETLYDLTLEDNSSHIFPINGYVLTHNCGGGNPLSHPDLLPFLRELKARGLVANMTVNQKHFKPYAKEIQTLLEEKLIHGLGVSYNGTKYQTDIAPFVSMTSNMVFHLIMGINSIYEIDDLMGFVKANGGESCKVLILGYKDYGNGSVHYLHDKEAIEHNKLRWFRYLASFFKSENLTLSFDNLAISQLNLKRFFTDAAWNRFFMGSEGSHTQYIDAIKQEFAICSIDPVRKSFDEISLFDYFQSIPR